MLAFFLHFGTLTPGRYPPARLHAMAKQQTNLAAIRDTIHEMADVIESAYEHSSAWNQPGTLVVNVLWDSMELEEAAMSSHSMGIQVSFLRGDVLERKKRLDAQKALKNIT